MPLVQTKNKIFMHLKLEKRPNKNIKKEIVAKLIFCSLKVDTKYQLSKSNQKRAIDLLLKTFIKNLKNMIQ